MEELQQYLQSIAYLPFSHNLNNKGKKNNGREGKITNKQTNDKMSNQGS
jgi:hypothetical protein